MHSQSYCSPTNKSGPTFQPFKYDNHNHNQQGMTAVGSPRANFELYRIDERLGNYKFSNPQMAKSTIQAVHSPHETKYHLPDKFSKNNRPTSDKSDFGSRETAASSRYGDMKSSYMGPDSRETAYMKETPNQNSHFPKKLSKSIQPFIFGDISQSEVLQSAPQTKEGSEQKNFSRKINQMPFQKNTPTLTSTASSSKIDSIDKMRMRRSSYDYSEHWVNTLAKKKTEKKWALNDFEQIRELGSGKYGRVFLVKEKQSEFLCALKLIEKQMLKEEEITQQFIRELKIQTFLNHPNIIKMYGFFEDHVNIYIIMEVALGGQLYKLLREESPLPEPKTAVIMKQVVQAIHELHSNHIIHRDIKPENIVMGEKTIVKLCDFGWSVYHGQTLRNTFCGTPLYVSPEILKGNNYDEKIDIWSLGIMMYEMLTGENPFKITQEEELIKIIKDSVSFPSYCNVSEEAKDFVLCCLQKNPEKRKSIRELLHHQFLRKYSDKGSDKKMRI